MATCLSPKAMAQKLVRMLRVHHPNYHYPKKVFQHTRVLLEIGPAPQAKRLPALLTDAELVAFYEAVWNARHLTHVVMPTFRTRAHNFQIISGIEPQATQKLSLF